MTKVRLKNGTIIEVDALKAGRLVRKGRGVIISEVAVRQSVERR